ncbi:MAG: hypothetical protein KDC79_14745 [Cyclobacteriaceae bacterium]|nr:hypothetical protein [Cyclobacteriaceae bacterium]
MKTLVAYYSNTGSNKYLAEKIAHTLGCEIEVIQPKIKPFMLLLIASSMNLGVGIKSLIHKPELYNRIILVGPIWMGRFIAPLRGFIRKYKTKLAKLYFVTCCGSRDETKNDKFGYATVFPKIEAAYGKPVHCEAFPIALALPEDKVEDGEAIMNTRLSDQNFKGRIKERFEVLINTLGK